VTSVNCHLSLDRHYAIPATSHRVPEAVHLAAGHSHRLGPLFQSERRQGGMAPCRGKQTKPKAVEFNRTDAMLAFGQLESLPRICRITHCNRQTPALRLDPFALRKSVKIVVRRLKARCLEKRTMSKNSEKQKAERQFVRRLKRELKQQKRRERKQGPICQVIATR
jgi:hypothetical protein